MGKRSNAKGNRKKRKQSGANGEAAALAYVLDWVFSGYAGGGGGGGGGAAGIVFDLHAHSNHSDGFLSPAALVERARRNGVKVLALTDHDTMGGVCHAREAAQKYGMRIIPGVEISALFSPRLIGSSELVHILAYFDTSGPSMCEELDAMLSSIRNGRYDRAKNIILKLHALKVPLMWDHVLKIAGEGVAPGRLHIARAMVEAGYVEDTRQAFNSYLHDGGPAFALGSEPPAESVVQLISRCGGFSVLAHPWTLKNASAVVRSLKAAGLHALEVFRSDGKVAEFSEIADLHGLLKLGGSDFHGRGEKGESDLGTVHLPAKALYDFLRTAQPIWSNASGDKLCKECL